MDINRKTAKGELSSLLGPKALKSDIFYRTLGIRRSAQTLYNNLVNTTRLALDTYVNGVNDYINSAKTRPHELRTVGYNYETWTAVDSISILKMYQWKNSGNFLHELMRLRLLIDKGMSPQRVKVVDPPYPLTPGAAFSSFDPTELDESQVNIQPNIAAENISIALEEVRVQQLQSWMGILGNASTNVEINSLEDLHNNWDPTYGQSGTQPRGVSLTVLSFQVTTISEYPVLGMSTKGQLSAPSEYFVSQVQFPLNSGSNYFVIGSSLPGLPGFLNARAEGGAWSVTPMGADTTDIYVMNDTVKGQSYYYNGNTLNYTIYNETIYVLGQNPVTITAMNSVLGPVINGGISNCPGNNTLVVRWPGFDNDTTLDWLWNSFQTSDFTAFLTLTQNSYQAPAATVVYAGQDSNPVFVQAGYIPLRVDGHTGLFPAIGNGTYDWLGWVNPFGTRRWPTTSYFVLGGARLVGRGYRHRLGLDWEDEFVAPRVYYNLKSIIDSGAFVTASTVQGVLSENFDSIFTSFKAILQLLPNSAQKTQLLAWNQVCDGTTTSCGLWRSWYWQLTKLGANAGTGILYYDNPRFLLSALLNGDSSCGGTQNCIQFAANALSVASASTYARPVKFTHYLLDQTAWGCLCDKYTTTYGTSGTANPMPDSDPTKGPGAYVGCAYKHVLDYNSNVFNFQIPLGNTGWQWLKYYYYDSYISSWTQNGFSSMSITYKTLYTQNIYAQ